MDLTWCSLAFEAVGRAQPLGSDPPWKRAGCVAALELGAWQEFGFGPSHQGAGGPASR